MEAHSVGEDSRGILDPGRMQQHARLRRWPAEGALSELAATLGYADQAHLSRDFRATVGMSPSEYADSVRRYQPD